MNLSPVLRQRYFDANGLPLAGGLLYSYAAGTSTPQGTYSNSTGTTNANPVVLDANGYADVWIDPSLAYKFILQDSGANVLWSVDNVSFPTGISTWSINTSYSQGQLVADSSGQGLLYVSLTNSNQGNALTSVANWRIFGGNVTSVSVNTTLTVTHELVRSNSTSGALTHTLPACSTTPIGKKITVKDVGTGGFTTSIKGNGTDVVDGAVTYTKALVQYASATFVNNGTSWDIANISGSTTPTVQRFTSGSGTYTTPSGVKWLRVRLAGGGGGGAAIGGTGGGNGGNSTFGSSLLTANGGTGAGTTGTVSAGGTATVAAPAIAVISESGGSGSAGAGTAIRTSGGVGGSNLLGGAGGAEELPGLVRSAVLVQQTPVLAAEVRAVTAPSVVPAAAARADI